MISTSWGTNKRWRKSSQWNIFLLKNRKKDAFCNLSPRLTTFFKFSKTINTYFRGKKGKLNEFIHDLDNRDLEKKSAQRALKFCQPKAIKKKSLKKFIKMSRVAITKKQTESIDDTVEDDGSKFTITKSSRSCKYVSHIHAHYAS